MLVFANLVYYRNKQYHTGALVVVQWADWLILTLEDPGSNSVKFHNKFLRKDKKRPDNSNKV